MKFFNRPNRPLVITLLGKAAILIAVFTSIPILFFLGSSQPTLQTLGTIFSLPSFFAVLLTLIWAYGILRLKKWFPLYNYGITILALVMCNIFLFLEHNMTNGLIFITTFCIEIPLMYFIHTKKSLFVR